MQNIKVYPVKQYVIKNNQPSIAAIIIANLNGMGRQLCVM